jgi:hypothetical protein
MGSPLPTDPPPPDDVDPNAPPATDPPDDVDPPEGDPPADLGDAGKRALDAMKARLKVERESRKQAEQQLAEARQKASQGDADAEAQRVRADALKAATDTANQRILRSEIRAAATGKLEDPKDALVFLDLGQFEVGDDGDVDAEEVSAAIDKLIKDRPYLAAARARRFQGTGDSGSAGRNAGGAKQVTEAELKTMSPEAIVKAQTEGRLADLLTGK